MRPAVLPLLLLPAALACGNATGPHDGAPPTVVLARDAFARTLSNAWGRADIGGNYYLNSPLPFHVDGMGIVNLTGTSPENAVLDGAYGTDVRGKVRFSIDRMPQAGFHMVQVYARRDDTQSDGDNYYRFRVRAFSDHRMDLRIQQNVDAHEQFVTEIVPIGLTFEPGTWYWIRWEAIGPGNATRLRLRVWRDGTAEPTTWPVDIVRDEPRLQRRGTTGVWVQAAVQQTSWPVRFYFNDLLYEGVLP
jgi:hypothetical protein